MQILEPAATQLTCLRRADLAKMMIDEKDQNPMEIEMKAISRPRRLPTCRVMSITKAILASTSRCQTKRARQMHHQSSCAEAMGSAYAEQTAAAGMTTSSRSYHTLA